MVSKKKEREIIQSLKRTRWTLPLTLSLMAGLMFPLSASAAEAETETEAVEAVEADEETVVDPEVNEDSLRYLLLVDTFETAERIPTKRLATPANVQVITADEIDANHYQSVPEALSHVIGLGYDTNPNKMISPQLEINGNDRVLILVDGRRTFAVPPMKIIDRIEIVKGGGSALYGSDAVGGVVNIITKKGDHDETTFDVNTGSWHRHTYEITNQGNDGKLGWFIDAGIGKSRPYKYSGGNDPQNSDLSSDYDRNWVDIKLDHRFDDRNSLTFDILHYSNKYNRHNNAYERNANDYAFSFDYVPKYDLINQVSLAYNFKEGTSTPGFLRYFNNYKASDEIFYEDGNSRLQGVDYQNGWEMGQHKFIVGAEWHQSADQHQFINFGNDKRKVTNQAYYIQDTISMGCKWTVVPGTRFDRHSQFGHQWSPKLAANYQPDDQTKIYASWGRVYQAPDAKELYSSYLRSLSYNDVPYYIQSMSGNKNLNPEAGHVETLGIEHDFSDKVNVALNLFNANISDYLDMNDVTAYYINQHYYNGVLASNEYQYVNSSKDKQRGLDLNYRQKIDDHWSYNVGYAYTHRERPLGAEETLSHFRTPKNSYKASIRYQNGPWKASLHGMFGSGSNGSHYMEDDFAFLDFNVSCDVADWATVYAKAVNFTNQNRSYYGRKFNMPGRLFQIGLDCRF